MPGFVAKNEISNLKEPFFATLFHRDLPEYVFLMGNKGLLGIVIGAALLKTGDFIGDFYNRAAMNDDGLAALNTMLAQDGILIYLPAHTFLKHPLQSVCAGHLRNGGFYFLYRQLSVRVFRLKQGCQ